jgi:hypothetical protein
MMAEMLNINKEKTRNVPIRKKKEKGVSEDGAKIVWARSKNENS